MPLKPHDACVYCAKGWARMLPEYLYDNEPHKPCGDGVMVHTYPKVEDGDYILRLRKAGYERIDL